MNIPKFLFVFAASIFIGGFAAKQSAIMAQDAPISKSDKVIEEPDIMPIYPGGTPEMHRFIANTLKYPEDARERKAQGLVVYTFVVEKDGSLSNFNILHRADPLLNEEALRILQAMPSWRPARHKGEIVRSETYVPMYFRLNQNAMASGNPVQPTRNYSKTKPEVIENNTIYTIVDKMPQYTYGESGLSDFISHNIRYPREARQEGIEGRILCSFIVASDGAISNIEVVEGSNKSLNEEAVRVLGLMPKWIPGENNGEKVHVKCLLPIDFIIDEDPIPPLL
ncbi:energy transducer TonB [Proteiniphilum sp.]|uniref:energy transducer TonB n=1 Tax=Proteiniphilum sp. TaxID=1926877 RepID=UPI00332BF880